MDSFHQSADDRWELTVTRLLLLNIFSFFRLYSELLGCEDALNNTVFPPCARRFRWTAFRCEAGA